MLKGPKRKSIVLLLEADSQVSVDPSLFLVYVRAPLTLFNINHRQMFNIAGAGY